ncbi:hypothetical protein AC1031_020704 [Aphanomyces cochlioides]|nr:hypothetical protein AC1031_020704 [Aphanomyces cochlioides]
MSRACYESLKEPKVIGRWTCEEHERFLLGMTLFPNGPWKRVAAVVKTRTVHQLRTHAQKYRAKLAREEQQLVQCSLVSFDDDLAKSSDDDFTILAKLLEPIEFTKKKGRFNPTNASSSSSMPLARISMQCEELKSPEDLAVPSSTLLRRCSNHIQVSKTNAKAETLSIMQ